MRNHRPLSQDTDLNPESSIGIECAVLSLSKQTGAFLFQESPMLWAFFGIHHGVHREHRVLSDVLRALRDLGGEVLPSQSF